MKNLNDIILTLNSNNTIETRIQEIPSNRPLIGISMPTQFIQRWIQDGDYLKEYLEDLGYDVELQYAGGDSFAQLTQIENMLSAGAVGLIIAPENPASLQYILTQAKEENIPVIAYDRLIWGTDAVNYYTSFDSVEVGALIGAHIVDRLGLEEGAGPFNVEFFSGSPNDNNAYILENSMYLVLEKYINNGQLQVPSGESTFAQTWTMNWSKEAAKERMSELLDNYYQDRPLHAIISASDSMTNGIVEALEEAGYEPGDNWPIITGQDAEIAAVRRIIEGKQAMTVFKDVRVLAKKTAEIMDGLLKGQTPKTDEFLKTFNGFIMVPTYLAETKIVDEGNYKEVLIDSGYYTEEELLGENENRNTVEE